MEASSKEAFIGFRCSAERKTQAEQEARRRGTSLSELMRRQVANLCSRNESGATGAYIDLFGPPALANTSDTYFQAYAAVRDILEGAGIGHATVALDAAQDAAERHVERHLNGKGRQGNGDSSRRGGEDE